MIEVRLLSTALAPGDDCEVTVSWSLALPPEELLLSLLWYTEGKGTQDSSIVESRSLGRTSSGTSREKFIVPHFPYSFNGKLVSLVWAVEAYATPAHEVARETFIVSPSRRSIDLSDHIREEVL